MSDFSNSIKQPPVATVRSIGVPTGKPAAARQTVATPKRVSTIADSRTLGKITSVKASGGDKVLLMRATALLGRFDSSNRDADGLDQDRPGQVDGVKVFLGKGGRVNG